jgi:hypothetical protein
MQHGIGPDGMKIAAEFLAASFAGRLAPRGEISCAFPRR